MVFHQRSKSRQTQPHSFDYQPVDRWLEALRQFDYDDIHLKISGGEPFLDRKNLRDLMIGLSEMKHIRVGIDTNGYWDPEYFRDVDKSTFWLNVAFHPSQLDFKTFFPNLLAIRDSGFHIPIINFVLAPENIDQFDMVYSALEKEKFFVNISTLIPTGIYLSRTERTERELNIIEKYNTPLDNYFKVIKPETKGRPCFYPAMTYYLMYDGSIRVACIDGTARNLFTEGPPPIPRQAVACEYQQCVACADMYRALVDEPKLTRPLKLYTLEDFADEVQEYRREGSIDAAWFRSQIKPAPEQDLTPLIPLTPHVPVPDSPVFGYSDHSFFEVRDRDRISISGWAASQKHGAVKEVRIRIAGEEIGIVKDFFSRPEIAISYGRADLANCGWRTMLFLPHLRHGEHQLIPTVIDADGTQADLPAITVKVVD
jgi:organic radical activating enzyme